jgi:hypothetical protein
VEKLAMILTMLVLAQADPPEAAPQRGASIDLPATWHTASCVRAEDGNDIVVCGKRDANEKFRARPLPEKYAEVGGPGIGIDLGKGARGNLHTEPGGTIDGKVAQRILFTVTLPF